MASVSKRHSKKQRKAARRQAQLDRDRRICEERDAQRKAWREQYFRVIYKKFNDITDEGDANIEALSRKLASQYDVWTSVYNTACGDVLPYLFVADSTVFRRQTYMDDHRGEIYKFFDETYALAKATTPEGVLPCVVVMTNPPDGEMYGSMFFDEKSFLKVAEAAGVGTEATGYVAIASFVANNPDTKMICL